MLCASFRLHVFLSTRFLHNALYMKCPRARSTVGVVYMMVQNHYLKTESKQNMGIKWAATPNRYTTPMNCVRWMHHALDDLQPCGWCWWFWGMPLMLLWPPGRACSIHHSHGNCGPICRSLTEFATLWVTRVTFSYHEQSVLTLGYSSKAV